MSAYFCNPDEIVNGLSFLHDFIDSNEASTYKFIIYESITERDIFFSELHPDRYKSFLLLNQKLINKNIKLYFILSGVPHDYYDLYNHSNIEIIFTPFYFINFLINQCKIDTWDSYNQIYKKNLLDNSFNTLVLNLNNRPHRHRCLMMDCASKSGLIEKMAYTWQEEIENYDFYKFRWWIPRKKSTNMHLENHNCLDILHNNPAFHLVTESETCHISFSEKVFKPILTGIPFLVFGGVGFHTKLKEYGFELYDEIFDYSFDLVDNDEERAFLICNNFLKYKNKNYKEIVDTIYSKVEKNRNHALSIFNDKKFIPNKLIHIFKNYVMDNEEIVPQVHHRLKEYLN